MNGVLSSNENQAGLAANNATSQDQEKFETKSSTELKNYENSKTFETVKNPTNVITRIDAALLTPFIISPQPG